MTTASGVTATALAVCLGLASCSSEDATAPDDPSTGSSPASSSSAPGPEAGVTTSAPAVEGGLDGPVVTVADGVQIPDDPAGEHLIWALGLLNGEEATADEVASRFAPALLEQVPADVLGEQIAALAATGPMTLTSVESDGRVLEGRLDAPQPLVVTVTLDDTGLMAGLLFAPDPSQEPEAASVEDVTTNLEDLAEGAQAQTLVAQVSDDGECVPLDGVGYDEPGPVGSAFKLYVLGTLADAVEDGDLAWDDELTVDADLVSLPTGRLQDEPDGTTVTVQEAADLMISISDNTATDLLIEALTPERIEADLADLGLQDVDGMTPFPLTTEMFQMIWGPSDEAQAAREAWPTADTDEQRALLADLQPGVADIAIEEITEVEPYWQDGFDWFATPMDLCRAHVALQQRARTESGEPIREILAENPGVPPATDAYTYLGYKGGSLATSVTGSWYGELDTDASSDVRVVVVGMVQAETTVPPDVAVRRAGALLELAPDLLDAGPASSP